MGQYDPFRPWRAEPIKETEARLRLVLAGLTFPAAHWRVVAVAEHHGADALSLRQLYDLPAGKIYRNTSEVVDAVLMLDVPAPRSNNGWPR